MTATPSREVPALSPQQPASLAHALDLARSLAADELRLLRIEWDERVAAALHHGAWIACAAACLALAWGSAWVALLVALGPYLSLEVRLAMLALAQGVTGAWLLARGVRRRVEPE